MANVIATIPGRRPERIVLASHYDTKRCADFRFVGASDGASSTAALLELGARPARHARTSSRSSCCSSTARKPSNWDWAGTDNTYGSRYYVQAAQKAGTLGGIKALVLLDMIGDRDLVIRRDADLDAVAGGHRLGRRRPARPSQRSSRTS